MVLRRLFGLVLMLVAVFGIILCTYITIAGRQLVADAGTSLGATLTLTSDSLDTAHSTLLLTKTAVGQAFDSLGTMETTAADLARTISETQPLISQTTQVATEEVPDGLEAVVAAIPDMVQVADAIDNTLTTLSAFNFERTILGIPLGFNLGVEYDPAVPFDVSVARIGESLDGLPEQLRGLESHLATTSDNLATMSDNMSTMSSDLNTVNSSIGELLPLIDEYLRIASESSDRVRLANTDLTRQVAATKLWLTVIMLWLGLSQLAPLYLGMVLLTGRGAPIIGGMRDEG